MELRTKIEQQLERLTRGCETCIHNDSDYLEIECIDCGDLCNNWESSEELKVITNSIVNEIIAAIK